MSSRDIASATRDASRILATLSADQRRSSLVALSALVLSEKAYVLLENKKDLQAARNAGLSASLVSRLDLSKSGKYEEMTKGILDVANLDDLLGKCTQKRELDDNLILRRVLCPIGVLLVIFEARPEVIVNITALALKSGNAAILKGGKESKHSFRALSVLVKKALTATNIPEDAISLIESRDDVSGLLAQEEYIDLVIPRGSNALVKNIKNNTRINVMGHADGLCHIYVDRDADLSSAIPIILDAKTNYVAACNAVECLLIHESLVSSFLPIVSAALNAAGVTCKIHGSSIMYAEQSELNIIATDEDFDTEYLSLTLSIRTVRDIDEAISWINTHGSHHTDAIMTTSASSATKFQRSIDSASVFVNCSTRFADGMRYGLGTEVGIATGKIHARGPVGLEGLMTYKWLLDGSGQGAADYSSDGLRRFTHKDLGITQADNY